MSRVNSRCRVGTALALAGLLPSAARAGEGEKALSLVPEYAAWSIRQEGSAADMDYTAHGGQLGVDFERGIGDTAWLRASVVGGVYDGTGGTNWAAGGTIGITYAIDVLRYVPFANAGVGALVIGGGGLDVEVKPVVELGFGLDVLESRTWSWGFVVRGDAFASDVVFLTIGPRVTWRWGYF